MRKDVRQKTVRILKAQKALAMALCLLPRYQLDPATKRLILSDGDEWDVQASIVLDLLRQAGYHLTKTRSDK